MSDRPEETRDTPEMIEYCLRCPWDKCWGCLYLGNAYSFGLRLELDENVSRKLARKILRGVS